MEKRAKFSTWYIFLAIWAVLIIHGVIVQSFQVKTIPYSEFLSSLEKGKIEEITITQNQIQGKRKNIAGAVEKQQTFNKGLHLQE
jgi:cell division protease FtsH